MRNGNEQLATAGAFLHLDKCCELVGKKYACGNIRDWTNGDYVKLSAIILKETGTLISANTLKRIFGKIRTSSRYFPQKATRDSLARYAGFADWEDFEEKHPVREGPLAEDSQNTFPGKQKFRITGRQKILFGGLLAVLLPGLWLWTSREQLPVNTENIALYCKNPVGGNPHSAIFKLLTPPEFSNPSANFLLDFGDGREEYISANDSLITHYYELPGRYLATLKYNDLTLDTVAVYLTTESWTATATMMYDSTRVYPVINTPLFKNGEMFVNSEDLYRAGIDTNTTFFVHFVLSKPMGISGDNFIMTARVKSSLPRPGVRCSQLVVTVFGEKTDHNFFIIKPGCITWSKLRFSEIVKYGKHNDLSFLGADLTGGGTFKLEVADKSVSLWINGSLQHTTKYQVPLREIQGIQFAFAGPGYVDHVAMKDLNTGKEYVNDFTE